MNRGRLLYDDGGYQDARADRYANAQLEYTTSDNGGCARKALAVRCWMANER